MTSVTNAGALVRERRWHPGERGRSTMPNVTSDGRDPRGRRDRLHLPPPRPDRRGARDRRRTGVLVDPRPFGRARRAARPRRVGRKRLPDGERRERFWAYVDRVGRSPAAIVDDLAAGDYWTRTRGLRHQPGPRLAGEGAYGLARHGAHVHLAYAVRRGGAVTEVRDDLRIAPEASYVVAVLAESVDRRSGDTERRFLPLEPGDLDVRGAQMVLIATGDTLVAELRARIDPGAEQATMAELRDVVRRASGRPPSAPLLEGIWH